MVEKRKDFVVVVVIVFLVEVVLVVFLVVIDVVVFMVILVGWFSLLS